MQILGNPPPPPKMPLSCAPIPIKQKAEAQWCLTSITSTDTYTIVLHVTVNTGVPYTLAKLAICYYILHFGYQSLDRAAIFATVSFIIFF